LKLAFKTVVEIKNDGLTAEAGNMTLNTIIAERLCRATSDLPWVLGIEVTAMKEQDGKSQ